MGWRVVRLVAAGEGISISSMSRKPVVERNGRQVSPAGRQIALKLREMTSPISRAQSHVHEQSPTTNTTADDGAHYRKAWVGTASTYDARGQRAAHLA